jgi:hypothetical protein
MYFASSLHAILLQGIERVCGAWRARLPPVAKSLQRPPTPVLRQPTAAGWPAARFGPGSPRIAATVCASRFVGFLTQFRPKPGGFRLSRPRRRVSEVLQGASSRKEPLVSKASWRLLLDHLADWLRTLHAKARRGLLLAVRTGLRNWGWDLIVTVMFFEVVRAVLFTCGGRPGPVSPTAAALD